MTESGMVEELNLKAGDVVEWGGIEYTVQRPPYLRRDVLWVKGVGGEIAIGLFDSVTVISRANASPKTWGKMTPEEKGALLLAEHEGEVIQWWACEHWIWRSEVYEWRDDTAYRVKPEPERVTEKWCWGGSFLEEDPAPDTIQNLTFETIDGRIDPASVRVEDVSDG